MGTGYRSLPKLGPTSVPRAEIHALNYYVIGDADVKRQSRVVVNQEDTGKSRSQIQTGGVFDTGMGPTGSSTGESCRTCLLKWSDTGNDRGGPCLGHFGHIDVRYPIYNTFFIEDAALWLQAICHQCGNTVVNKVNAPKHRLLREYASAAKPSSSNANCHNCGYTQPHIVIGDSSETHIQKRFYKKDKTSKLEDLPAHEATYIFGRVTPETVEKVGRNQHPSKYTRRFHPVPPNTMRPSMKKFGSNKAEPDDITLICNNIVKERGNLPEHKIWGERENLNDNDKLHVNKLHQLSYSIIRTSNKQGSGIHVSRDGDKKTRNITTRIKGKQGRIRRNLLGRRVWVVARSFITCDNMLAHDEVGIPEIVAREIQVQEVVGPHNLERCKIFLANGRTKYPGAKLLIRREGPNPGSFTPEYAAKTLMYGDILLRDVVDDDIVSFNRQPSLLFSSMVSFRVRVLRNVMTFRMNLQIVEYFNADFDGDAMILIFSTSEKTRNEIKMLANSSQFFISYKDSKPVIGNAHDSLIGMATLTRDSTRIDKAHAMYMVRQIPLNWDFSEVDQISGRDMVTKLWQTMGLKFNYRGTPQFYDEKRHARYHKFPSSDIKVSIKNGVLESGILDKSSIGGGARGGIYQIVHNQYSPGTAEKLALYMQWMALEWIGLRGFTIHFGDILISKEAKAKIDQRQAAILADSMDITERLNAGNIVPPLGKTVDEHYEDEQLNALKVPDEIFFAIYEDTDLYNNNLSLDVFHGVRGNQTNIRSTNSALMQQSIHGERMKENYNRRCLMYFPRYDSHPRSRGYISNSYLSGLTPGEMLFHTQEGRFALINRSQNTAQTGYQNRLASKSLEPCIVDNHRRTNNNGRAVQMVYGGDGVDPRFLETVKIPTFEESRKVDGKMVPITDQMIRTDYLMKPSDFDVKGPMLPKVKEALEAEVEQLIKDRHDYIETQLLLQHILEKPYQSGVSIPVNVERILENIVTPSKAKLDPLKLTERVKQFCDELVFVLINDTQRKRYREGEYVPPDHLRAATRVLQMVVRVYFSTRYLTNIGASMEQVELAMQEIERIYRRNLISYGKCIGIIASQCISEPMTQQILDSHHSAGAGVGKKKDIERVKQILGVTEAKHPEDGSMTLHVLPEYRNNERQVREIANTIEMMKVGDFVDTSMIFFESFPKKDDPNSGPVHPDYITEKGTILDFLRYNPVLKVPNDLTKWCFRIGLNKMSLIGKNMTIAHIYRKLHELYPKTYIVYTQDNAPELFLRIYLRSEMVRDDNLNKMKALIRSMIDTVIRGVPGIRGARVEKYKNHRYMTPEGGLKSVEGWYIQTIGSNLSDILDMPFFDHRLTQSDRIIETYSTFGLGAANAKLISELMFQIGGVGYRHYTIYADEMTFTGAVTSINRYGTANREMPVMLRASDSSPMVAFKDAAIRGARDEIKGVSPALMMGKPPKIGDLYNPIIVDEAFIAEVAKEREDVM